MERICDYQLRSCLLAEYDYKKSLPLASLDSGLRAAVMVFTALPSNHPVAAKHMLLSTLNIM
jgi:hypothetical protein